MLDVGIAAIFVLVGFGAWSYVHRNDSGSTRHGIIGEPSPGGPPLSLASSLPAIGTPVNAGAPADSGAPDGTSAVERYLQAEAAGDTGASFLLLSAGDRAEHDSPAKWARDHASLPTIRAYRLGAVATANDKTTVGVSLDLQPVLDFVSGDVPAHADGEFVAVPEGDAWYVSLADSTTTAAWPSDQGATDAATSWVAARQRCETANEFESLVGSPALADQLCHSTDTVSVEAPQRLQSSDSAAVVAAFGDQSIAWARVVTIGGAHPLRAVLAPLGDSWIVIGVLAATP